MAKNIQICANCGVKISGEHRMQLMMGPKGYRSYAVHAEACRKKMGRGTVRSVSRKGMIKAGVR